MRVSRQLLADVRKRTAREIFALASRIQKRDHWFIGGYLGTVMEEWEEKENKNVSKTRKPRQAN